MTRLGDETMTSFAHGRRSAVGTSAVALTGASARLSKGVQLKAAAANAGVVYVGNAALTADSADATDGFPLAAGESLFVPVDDPAKIYLLGSAAGQKVFWLAM